MLDDLHDECIVLCLRFLCAHDLAHARAASTGLRSLGNLDELWKPLALHLPGVGCAFAAGAPDLPSWRCLVATWTTCVAIRQRKSDSERLRLALTKLLDQGDVVDRLLQRSLRQIDAAREMRDNADKARDRLLTAHATWRMQTDGTTSMRVAGRRLPSPPPAEAFEEAERSLVKAGMLLDRFEAEATANRHLLRTLKEDVNEHRRQYAATEAVVERLSQIGGLPPHEPWSYWHKRVDAALMSDARGRDGETGVGSLLI